MLVSVSGACANSRASAPHFTFLALDLVSHFTFSALDLVSTLSSVLHSYSFRSFAVSMPGNAEVGKWSPEQNGAPMAHTDKGQCTIAVLERHLLAPAARTRRGRTPPTSRSSAVRAGSHRISYSSQGQNPAQVLSICFCLRRVWRFFAKGFSRGNGAIDPLPLLPTSRRKKLDPPPRVWLSPSRCRCPSSMACRCRCASSGCV
jgi:hypothetical protein